MMKVRAQLPLGRRSKITLSRELFNSGASAPLDPSMSHCGFHSRCNALGSYLISRAA
jgi:hypothetical protein